MNTPDSDPPNKWTKFQTSETADADAQTSTYVLDELNTLASTQGYLTSAAFSLACSDGTFVFISYYD
jgi:hypothetical protein